MKKLFTIDDFMIAFMSALGYGIGEIGAKIMGLPDIWCLVICFAVGIAVEETAAKIAYSKDIQKKPMNRVFIFTAFILIFLTGHYIFMTKLGVSLMDYLLEEFAFVVGLPVIGFAVSMLIRWYHISKIRKRYGDGSEGYVFDINSKDIEETNQQNKPVSGEYDQELAVKTKTGIYIGEKLKKTISYLGIPYAKPPVGALRWKAPEPLDPSEAVFEAKNFGASAIQVEHRGSIIRHHRQSEDCLTLNVVTGVDKAKKKKPVIVLFHLGDFSSGGSVNPLLYGEDFISEHPDTVFVSFNYRLGIFGFIDFSEIPGGEAYPDALNLGLLDQIAALKWIRENIAAFGGDPEQVTVIGFESGAVSICMLAACKQAKGLFRRAYVFNGCLETVYYSPEASRKLAKDLLNETHTGSMEELAKLDTSTLKDAAQKLWSDMCAPTCDGVLIPADVYSAYQDGAASGIEFVIGVPSDELQVFRSFIGTEKYKEMIAAAMKDIRKHIGNPEADEIRNEIVTQTDLSAGIDAQSDALGKWIERSIFLSAEKLAKGGSKVHLVYWNEKPLIEDLGSGTVDAAAALLGNKEASEMYGNVLNSTLSEVLQCFLQKYINGEPLSLYHNEIAGYDEFDWKPFPNILIVSDGKISCGNSGDVIQK